MTKTTTEHPMKPVFDFLRDDLYLPGFMTLLAANYDGREMEFDFHPAEPRVTRISLEYFTPRGTHITLSQAGYCLVERTAEERGIIQPGELRGLLEGARLKIVELNQKFRREVKLADVLRGRMEVARFREGRIPTVQVKFDFANRGITGEMIGMIAPKATPQMNAEILRN